MNSDRHVIRAGIFGCSLTLMSPKEPQLRASLRLSGMAMKGNWGETSHGKFAPGLKAKVRAGRVASNSG